jgi:hypothetical protein
VLEALRAPEATGVALTTRETDRAAAHIWGFEGILAENPEITVPEWRDGRRSGIVTHRPYFRKAM